MHVLNITAGNVTTATPGYDGGPGTLFRVDPATPASYGYSAKAKFLALNILAEMDSPGEYYIDRDAGLVRFLPPHPEAFALLANTTMPYYQGVEGPRQLGADQRFVFPVVTPAPTFVDVTQDAHLSMAANVIRTGATSPDSPLSWVNIRGFTVSFSRGVGIKLSDAVNVTLADLDVSQHTGQAMSISSTAGTGLAGSQNVLVSRIRVLYTGCSGIGIGKCGDRMSLRPGNVTIRDSEIGYFSRWPRTYNAGLGFGGVANTWEGNCVHNAPHTAISGSGNDLLFAKNYISDVLGEVGDSGAWYTGRNWATRGNVLRNNTFYRLRQRIPPVLGASAISSIYFDDQQAGQAAIDNTIIDVFQGFLIGGGRDNVVTGNTIINSSRPVYMDARGLSPPGSVFNNQCNITLTPPCVLLQSVLNVNYLQPPYSVRYPEIVNVTTYKPCTPVGNLIANNRYCASLTGFGVPDGEYYIGAAPIVVFGSVWSSATTHPLHFHFVFELCLQPL